jgi:hypothetical protein
MSIRCDRITIRPTKRGARRTGRDLRGRDWIEFDVNYDEGQEDATCSICGRPISSGWVCLAGCDEVCNDHVIVEGRG